MMFGGVLSRGRRFSVLFGLAGAVAVALTAMASPAEAARKKKRVGGYNPPYAAMVIDAKSGRTLHAVNEDALRHPASVTKVMTLYMLFEQMERGRFRMDSPLRVSAHAARMAPSKIGFTPGETIDVEDAIMALITKSANDVAATVAENVSGSEEAFAEAMTRKARSLGMNRTVFRNASGLPDREQVTTARDLTILARAIQERFPRYYGMFSKRNFEYAGRNYRNHNKLLGRVEGVDGIKTGYTRLSGFNLMTSAKADSRHIVSIVLGGRSGRIRDNIMADLVVAHLPRATTGPRTTLVAEAPSQPQPAPVPVAAAPAPEKARPVVVAAAPAPVTTATTNAAVQQRTRGVQPIEIGASRPVMASTTPSALRWAVGQPSAQQPQAVQLSSQPSAQPTAYAPTPPSRPNVLRPPANVNTTASIARASEPEVEIPAPARTAPVAMPKAQTTTIAKAEPAKAEPVKAEPEAVKSAGIGWVIQLGATDDEGKAKGILADAKSKSRGVLSDASAFTEKVQKGGATLFRARFAGFDDSKDAQNACNQLKRSGFTCFASRA